MPKLIRMVWDCPACGRKGIVSTSRQCTCGYVFGTDPKDAFRMPAEGEQIIEVTDAENPDELIENWRCDFCGSYNKYSDLTCTTCGHPRDESASGYFSVTGKEKSSRSDELSSDDIYEGSENIYEDTSKTAKEIDDAVHKRGEEKTYDQAAADIKAQAAKVQEKKRKQAEAAAARQETAKRGPGAGIFIGIVAVLVIGAFFLMRFLNTPKDGFYDVTGKSWERAIEIEEEKTFSESDWSMPETARLLRTAREIRTYRQVLDHYETVRVTRYRSVPHTETYYEDLGNGNAEQRTRTYYTSEPYEAEEERPVYRNEPVFDTKYYYEIDRYVPSRTVRSSGAEDEPYWGDVDLGPKEREGERKETYSFAFEDEGKTYVLETTYSNWKKIEKGGKVELLKTPLGRYTLKEDAA